MSAADRRAYDALPEVLTIYRGCESEDHIGGYSWSLDRDRAEWFARRFGVDGVIGKLEIQKLDALACFGERNEAEIVVDAVYLDDDAIEIESVMPKTREAA
ncbi:hypothetical protein BFN67_03440 [Pseudaminobacter manganicus]|uniref:Uncharacterized protein n=2 Tax=Manganibacter manganicus TaxID=1873176 RepID=A0A1V8RNL9_9HYPH|nr:hypothetical protein BFN67_03440 [Pseudaminobacter manganicus]